MSHKIAKLILEQAGTFLERADAVKTALGLGMPLSEIEAYLDWLDLTRDRRGSHYDEGGSDPDDSETRPKAG